MGNGRALETWLVRPGKRPGLDAIDPSGTPGIDGRARAEEGLAENKERLGKLQARLWAENRRALLVVLQGMDGSGKDGVVRNVMTGMDPAGCRVTSFQKPSAVELDHDFLWRIHMAVPAKGEVGVFNRSHYEDVLVARVRELVPPDTWKRRYEQIGLFERLLADGGTTLVKLYLHISKAEQKERLVARLADPDKNWKFDAGDLDDRRHWDDYRAAYEDAIERCNAEHAPWYVVPADRKWYRNWAVSEIVLRTLERMDPKPPKGKLKPEDFRIDD